MGRDATARDKARDPEPGKNPVLECQPSGGVWLLFGSHDEIAKSLSGMFRSSSERFYFLRLAERPRCWNLGACQLLPSKFADRQAGSAFEMSGPGPVRSRFRPSGAENHTSPGIAVKCIAFGRKGSLESFGGLLPDLSDREIRMPRAESHLGSTGVRGDNLPVAVKLLKVHCGVSHHSLL